MVRKILKIVGLVWLVFSFTGCMQVNSTVKVKPDGSGTVEETFMMSKMALQMMQGMASGMPQEGTNKKPFDIFDEEKLKSEASKKGEGVTYVSGEKVVTDKFEGYKAIYTFTDINKLKLNQNPGENMPSAPNMTGEEEKPKEYVTFEFTKGSIAKLVIKNTDKKKDFKADKDDNVSKPKMSTQEEQMMMAQMKQMFDGMKFVIAVEVEGRIVKTNATHQNGSTVTLMEMDFGKLMENPEKMLELSRSEPETLEEAKKIMKDVPGIKVDMNEQVEIEFK